jgi:hypothetical protein
MQKFSMGRTELPQDVIDEYLQSLAEIYTQEVNSFPLAARFRRKGN